jgi:hypothetical protein
MGSENGDIPVMREIVFRVISERPGHLEARADDRPITITAPSLEELHHEAREALIEHLGAIHVAYRVRIRRADPDPAALRHSFQVLPRRPAPCC